jgi:flagellar biosynthesis protein FliR
MTVPIDPLVVTAFVLALVRAAAWLFVAPPFNTRMIPTTVKAGIAAALALGCVPHIANPTLPSSTPGFIAALVVQVLVGVTLGMFTMLLVNALQAAGSFVDLFAGFSLSQIYDPLNGAQSAVFGRFYQLLATTLLFTTDAYLILVNGFFRSFDVIPAGGLSTETIARLLTNNMGQFLIAAIEIAGPVLGCLFLAEITLGLLARAAPNLNVFSLAFPLRVIIALIVVAIAIPVVGPALGNLVRDAVAPLGHG